MVYTLLTIVHVLVCLFLIVVVLLQSGKAADLAGAFGGMGSQTAFGPRGSATLLSKATTISAVLFMVTSLSLSILATKNAGLGTSVLETAPKTNVQKTVPAPVAPAPGPGTTFKRGRIWYASYYVNGRQVQRSSRSNNMQDAKRLRDQILGQKARGEMGGFGQSEKITCNELLDDLLEYGKSNIKPSTAHIWELFIKANIRPFFGHF